MESLKNFIYLTIPTLLFLIIILEIVFRTIIPAANPPHRKFDVENLMWIRNNDPETGVRTLGKFAEIQATWRINNLGWNYPIDYHPVEDRKLIAVFGDSFVEAREVDADKNFPYLLREMLPDDTYEVYAFGRAGAPFSQYLHMARYANSLFDPDILIFNLFYNDYDESIYELNPDRDHWLTLTLHPDSTISENQPKPAADVSFTERLLMRSAIVRYLYINIDIVNVWRAITSRTDAYNFEANVDVDHIQSVMEPMTKVTDHLFRTILEENEGKRIIFLHDAPRFAIYDDDLENSGVIWINEMVGEISAKYDAEYIDLTPLMYEDYMEHGRRFEFDIDSHWNEYGHGFVARVLYEYLMAEAEQEGL